MSKVRGMAMDFFVSLRVTRLNRAQAAGFLLTS